MLASEAVAEEHEATYGCMDAHVPAGSEAAGTDTVEPGTIQHRYACMAVDEHLMHVCMHAQQSDAREAVVRA